MKAIEKNKIKPEVCFLRKINIIDKPQAKLIRKKKEETQITTWNGRCEWHHYREYCEQHSTNVFSNFYEVEKFFEKYKLLKLILE